MKQWVDVPTGWAHGWPKLYDPEKDGDLLEWIHRMGYEGSLDWVRSWYQEEEKKDERNASTAHHAQR